MKITLLAAVAALSLGVGAAYADGGGQAQTMFTMMQAGQQPKAIPSGAAAAQDGAAVHTYVARSNQGTWLFPANQSEGGNN